MPTLRPTVVLLLLLVPLALADDASSAVASVTGRDVVLGFDAAETLQATFETEDDWLRMHHVLSAPAVRELCLPVRANVVLLGADDDDDLAHAVAELEHIVLPYGEEQLTRHPGDSRTTPFRFRFDVRVHRLPEAARALERMMRDTMRPDDEPGVHCVDAVRLSQAVRHLLASLGLDDVFSIVVLRTSSLGPQRYGFRSGLTRHELEALDADREWARRLESILQSARGLNVAPLAEPKDFRSGGDAAWAAWFGAHLLAGGGGGGDAHEAQLHSLTRHMATKGSAAQLELLREALAGSALSDCLVWSWIDSHRFALFDVTHAHEAELASPAVHSQRQPVPSVRHAVTSAFRHVVSPAVAPFAVDYAESVIFTLYVLRMQSVYDPRAHFDWAHFGSEMNKLAAPGQRFTYRVQEVGSELAVAVHMALRSAVLPNEAPERPSTVVYLDSKALRDLLRPATATPDADPSPGGAARPRRQRQVAVVLVSTAFAYPVLVDKYYVSKSLADMVVVSQSNFEAHHSRIHCNGAAVEWDLRNPLRHALAATATHLAGLVPPHLSYSRATRTVTQEWLWSVGDSPLSHTSHGTHFATHHGDIARRNYVLYELELSIRSANAATDALQAVHTTHSNFAAAPHVSELSATLKAAQARIQQLWKRVAADVYNTSAIAELRERTALFCANASAIAATIDGYRCARPLGVASGGFSWTPLVAGVLLLDVAVATGYWWLRRRLRDNKIKVN